MKHDTGSLLTPIPVALSGVTMAPTRRRPCDAPRVGATAAASGRRSRPHVVSIMVLRLTGIGSDTQQQTRCQAGRRTGSPSLSTGLSSLECLLGAGYDAIRAVAIMPALHRA